MSFKKIFKPHRGPLSTMSSTNEVLKEGELFIEYPEDGVGTGISKIKIGDGVTAYNDLPYAIDIENLLLSSIDASIADGLSASEILDLLLSSEDLSSIISYIYSLLANMSSTVDTVEEEMSEKAPVYHASEETTYGVGTNELYGHLKITDDMYSDDSSDTAVSTTALNSLVQCIMDGSMDIYLLTEDGDTVCTEDEEDIIISIDI